MALTARWCEIPDKPGIYRAACGLRDCCPEIAAAESTQARKWRYVMRAGMTFDVGRDEWRLSPKAAAEWRRFSQEGGNWKDFHPKGRHFARDPWIGLPGIAPDVRKRLAREGSPGSRNLESMDLPAEALPVRVRCPLCGWISSLGPVVVR
jgi:hypothetical protein